MRRPLWRATGIIHQDLRGSGVNASLDRLGHPFRIREVDGDKPMDLPVASVKRCRHFGQGLRVARDYGYGGT
jgi:hypothetical protein